PPVDLAAPPVDFAAPVDLAAPPVLLAGAGLAAPFTGASAGLAPVDPFAAARPGGLARSAPARRLPPIRRPGVALAPVAAGLPFPVEPAAVLPAELVASLTASCGVSCGTASAAGLVEAAGFGRTGFAPGRGASALASATGGVTSAALRRKPPPERAVASFGV